jgi:hypothetical protein
MMPFFTRREQTGLSAVRHHCIAVYRLELSALLLHLKAI